MIRLVLGEFSEMIRLATQVSEQKWSRLVTQVSDQKWSFLVTHLVAVLSFLLTHLVAEIIISAHSPSTRNENTSTRWVAGNDKNGTRWVARNENTSTSLIIKPVPSTSLVS